MGWLLLYLAAAVVVTAIAQRFVALLGDVVDDGAGAAARWLLAAVLGMLWPFFGPLGAVALAARALQRWYYARVPKRKETP